ncbi:MAG: hypothetical protein ACTSWN_05920, partial [Promethearchaeota archaeon]
KKAAELKFKELESKARIQDFTVEKIRNIAEKYGFILAINDEIKSEIDQLKEKYQIPDTRIIREIVKKEDIVNKKGKIDYERLGWFVFQQVLVKKEETGGIFTIPELYAFLKPYALSEKITIHDVDKAVQKLARINAIAGYEKLKSGIAVVYFFDEKFTSDYKIVLNIAKKKGFVTLEDLLSMGWSKQRANLVLTSLVKSGIARADSSYLTGKRWFFPAIQE